MKNKILIFVIGFLVGAILATGGFLIYEKTKKSDTANANNKFPGGNPMQMMQGENMQTPPEKPSGVMGEAPNGLSEDSNQQDTNRREKPQNVQQQSNSNTTNDVEEANI